MIGFDRFSISDMPKTGGLYIRHVFGVVEYQPRELRKLTQHTVIDMGVPSYIFARNPLDWHRSYISFIKNGSSVETGAACPIAQVLSGRRRLTFDNYIKCCLGEDNDVKGEIANISESLIAQKNNMYRRVVEWARSPTVPLYIYLFEMFGNATVLDFRDIERSVVRLSEMYNQKIYLDRVNKKHSETLGKIAISDVQAKMIDVSCGEFYRNLEIVSL